MIVRSQEQRELMGRAYRSVERRAGASSPVADRAAAGAMLSDSNARRVVEAPVTAVFCADLGASPRAPSARADARAKTAAARSQNPRGPSLASPRRSGAPAATAGPSRT